MSTIILTGIFAVSVLMGNANVVNAEDSGNMSVYNNENIPMEQSITLVNQDTGDTFDIPVEAEVKEIPEIQTRNSDGSTLYEATYVADIPDVTLLSGDSFNNISDTDGAISYRVTARVTYRKNTIGQYLYLNFSGSFTKISNDHISISNRGIDMGMSSKGNFIYLKNYKPTSNYFSYDTNMTKYYTIEAYTDQFGGAAYATLTRAGGSTWGIICNNQIAPTM